jgi:hypothetical protein
VAHTQWPAFYSKSDSKGPWRRLVGCLVREHVEGLPHGHPDMYTVMHSSTQTLAIDVVHVAHAVGPAVGAVSAALRLLLLLYAAAVYGAALIGVS